ncbi:MAG: ABC transporter substrate-binding protein [Gaiellales bacterium]
MGTTRSASRWMAAACVIAAAVAAGCGSSGGAVDANTVDPLTETVPASTIPADTPVEPGVFRVIGQPSLALDLVRSAAALGFAGREGLSMRIRTEASQDDVLVALRAGSADAAVVASDEALELASQGADIRIVLLLTTTTSGEAIVAAPPINGVGDLVGQRVAYAPGTDGELLLRGELAAEEVPITQVRLVHAGGRSPGTLLADGSADAAVVDGVQADDLAAAQSAVAPIATAGDQPGLLSRALVVRAATARTTPGRILAFVRAWQDLYREQRSNGDEIAATVATMGHVEPADVAAELDGIAVYDVPGNAVELLPGGEYYDRTLEQIDAAATAAGWLRAPVDVSRQIDGSFAQAVASAP